MKPKMIVHRGFTSSGPYNYFGGLSLFLKKYEPAKPQKRGLLIVGALLYLLSTKSVVRRY